MADKAQLNALKQQAAKLEKQRRAALAKSKHAYNKLMSPSVVEGSAEAKKLNAEWKSWDVESGKLWDEVSKVLAKIDKLKGQKNPKKSRKRAAKKPRKTAKKKASKKRPSAASAKKTRQPGKKRNGKTVIKTKRTIVLNGKRKKTPSTIKAKLMAPVRAIVVNGKKASKKCSTKKRASKKRNPEYKVSASLKSGIPTSKTSTVKALTHGGAVRKAKRSMGKRKGLYDFNVSRANPKKRASKKKAKNPTGQAAADRREFAGKYTGDIKLYFPQKGLQGLSTIGPLVLLKTDIGTIAPVHGHPYYARDAKGRIHIGAKEPGDLWAHEKGKVAVVEQVQYRAAKPHLGYPQVVTWYHDFEAPFPVLKADGKGGLMQVGGGYTIKREGIVG